jgi:hypothetical protein
LKQAAAVYYETVKKVLLSFNFPDGSCFRLSPADPCLFVRGSLSDSKSHFIAISMHIDDKFIACRFPEDHKAVSRIFESAKWNFTLETMTMVLGVHIHYRRWDPTTGEPGSMELDHEQYIEDAYKKFSPLIPKEKRGSRSVPVTVNVVKSLLAAKPPSWESYSKDRHKQYRSVLGTLSHVANFTHPEIAFAISFASQFMANPAEEHLFMVFGILLYVYTVKGKKIVYRRYSSPTSTNPIRIACDADLGNSKSQRSRTGYCAYLYGMLVTWHSRLQPSVSLSTAEAEYMAIAAAGRFAVWYKLLVGDFGVESCYHYPVRILSDNQSAICIAKNPITHKHSRHIDRRLHWLREQVLAGALHIGFVPTKENVSDIMTKALGKHFFVGHRDSLLLGFRFSDQDTDPRHSFFFWLDSACSTAPAPLTEAQLTFITPLELPAERECPVIWPQHDLGAAVIAAMFDV